MAEKSARGFAAMDKAKQREIASKGGKAAHAKGTAHEFTPEEAREAGRKGGQAAHAKGTAHEFTPEEAREAGRKGGQSSHGGQARVEQPEDRLAAVPEPPPLRENHEQEFGAERAV
jgi:general stress protein YciG